MKKSFSSDKTGILSWLRNTFWQAGLKVKNDYIFSFKRVEEDLEEKNDEKSN